MSTHAENNPVISNTGHFFGFNSTVSNLYNNDVIDYKIYKKEVVRTVLLVNEFYYNIGQILKVVHKKNFKNIDLYQWPVTDIRDRIYNSIPGGITAQSMLT